MKASIDRSGCIGCELCAELCPAVFRMADDGLAEVHVDVVPASEEDKAKEAEDSCPAAVISLS